MPFHQPDSIPYLTFEIFEGISFVHAAFTRIGGVSPSPWAELNVGTTVGDSIDNVKENKLRCFNTVGRDINSLAESWLVHGSDVLFVEKPRPKGKKYPQKADVILTDRDYVTLFMRYADCVPIIMYDPIRHVAGLVHAGWKGTLERVAAVGVNSMKEKYGSNPADIQTAIGPSIGPCHYQIGSEISTMVKQVFRQEASELCFSEGEYMFFDLWKTNELVLRQTGVRNIENPKICTACKVKDWFSHRAERGKTGRFGVLVGLTH
jgi:YfiH family protein